MGVVDKNKKSLIERLEALDRESKKKGALLDSARVISKHREFEKAAKEVFNFCKDLVGATAGYVALLSEDGKENQVVFLESGGLPCAVDPALPMPIRGLRGVAYEEGKAVYDNDFHNSKWMEFMPGGHVKLENVMFAPFRVGENVVGLVGIANKPGGFNDDDAEAAMEFGELVGLSLRNCRAEEKLKVAASEWKSTFDSISDFVSVHDRDFRFVKVNRALADYLGMGAEELIGKHCYEVLHGTDEPWPGCPHSKTLETGSVATEEVDDPNIGRALLVTTAPVTEEGKLMGSVHVAKDITERKKAEEQIRASLEEKEVLLREIHHRVKNNMNVISSMLTLQSMHVKDKRDAGLFRECRRRIKAMALVHEKLYQSEHLSSVNIGEYVDSLVSSLLGVYDKEGVSIKTDVCECAFELDTSVPLGLIISELVSNSLQHAFPGVRKGEIEVSIRVEDGRGLLIVRDNGIGLPENIDFKNADAFGLQIVNILTDQIEGEIELGRSKGTKFSVKFKV
jgi:PAS domain S-box-containing protein